MSRRTRSSSGPPSVPDMFDRILIEQLTVPDLDGGFLPSLPLLEMVSNMMTAEAIRQGGGRRQGRMENGLPHFMLTVRSVPPSEPPSRVVFESYKPGEETWEDKHTKTKCKICMEDEKVVQCVFQPCGHACACRSCAEKLLSHRGKCPICNTVTTSCFKYRKQILVQNDDDEEDKGREHESGGEKKRVRRST